MKIVKKFHNQTLYMLRYIPIYTPWNLLGEGCFSLNGWTIKAFLSLTIPQPEIMVWPAMAAKSLVLMGLTHRQVNPTQFLKKKIKKNVILVWYSSLSNQKIGLVIQDLEEAEEKNKINKGMQKKIKEEQCMHIWLTKSSPLLHRCCKIQIGAVIYIISFILLLSGNPKKKKIDFFYTFLYFSWKWYQNFLKTFYL